MMGRFFCGLLLALFVAGCGTSVSHYPVASSSGGGAPKLGKPYRINGVWYYPKDDPAYREVGMASWYGPGFHGRQTANGERYNMNALTAAHRTLPMPSFVRVTNLANGRSLVLRVNDRGPFAKGRIIDVSRRAAQLLGFEKAGVTRVQVVRVTPDGQPLPQARTAIAQAQAQAPTAPQQRGVFVQLIALSDLNRALALLSTLEPRQEASVDEVLVDGRRVYRVRFGPYGDIGEAQLRLADAQRAGYPEARIFTITD
ncbi:MAG: hypothetical protein Tsb0016_25790 [Sphingomonadales bacterium]